MTTIRTVLCCAILHVVPKKLIIFDWYPIWMQKNYCLPIYLDTTKENLKRIEQNATVCFAMHVYTTGVERNYNIINVFKIYFITRGIKRFWSYSLWSFSSMQYTYTKKTVLAIKKLGTSTYISISVTGSILYLFLSGCSEQKSVKFTWIQ